MLLYGSASSYRRQQSRPELRLLLAPTRANGIGRPVSQHLNQGKRGRGKLAVSLEVNGNVPLDDRVHEGTKCKMPILLVLYDGAGHDGHPQPGSCHRQRCGQQRDFMLDAKCHAGPARAASSMR